MTKHPLPGKEARESKPFYAFNLQSQAAVKDELRYWLGLPEYGKAGSAEDLLNYLPSEMLRVHKLLKLFFKGGKWVGDGSYGKLPGPPVDENFLRRCITAGEAKDFGVYAKAVLDTHWKGKSPKERTAWLKKMQRQMELQAVSEAEKSAKKAKHT